MRESRSTTVDVLAPLVSAFASDSSVTKPNGASAKFGSRGLRVCDKIFAMEVGGALVLKLSAKRIDALVEARQATRFVMRGRPMKEWAVLSCDSSSALELAREALTFVRGR